jgi:hypothetical protein
VVVIHLRQENDPRQLLGPGISFGPLHEAADWRVLCAWLRGGGQLGGPAPQRWRCLGW